MDNAVAKKKEKIAEIERQRAEKAVAGNREYVNATAAEQQLVQLLRVDSLMRGMRFFIDNENKPVDAEYDKNLQSFIFSYIGSRNAIYPEHPEKGQENLLKEVRDSIAVSPEFSFAGIKEAIPEAALQIENINAALAMIASYREDIKALTPAKAGKGAKEGADKEAEEVLQKVAEKVKNRDKSAKIISFTYRGDLGVAAKFLIKKVETDSYWGLDFFKPLNSPEGIKRLNDELAKQNKKSANKAERQVDNKALAEKRKALEAEIEKQNKKLAKHRQELGSAIKGFLQKLPADRLLAAFANNAPFNGILSGCTNFDELKKTLADSFKKDKNIWNYVKDAKYYDLIKNVVRGPYNEGSKYKNYIPYEAMPAPLKDLIKIREIELYGLKNPVNGSVDEMNDLLQKYDYKILPQKINLSQEEKAGEFKGKSNLDIAKMVLNNAQIAKDRKSEAYRGMRLTEEKELTPYQRRCMTLGMMYALGEGTDKNDDGILFRKYMEIYFDKKGFTSIEALNLQKEYGWSDFKKNNGSKAAEAYKEIKTNAKNPDALKENLLNGIWGEGDIHHIVPRRFAFMSSNPNEFNNQPNLAITAQWEVWSEDNHQLEHFFNMSQNDGVNPYLTRENGMYARKGEAKGISELYYEKPQVWKDGKWTDLIPQDTLFITPNMTITAPELSEGVRQKALDCFKTISVLEKQKEPNTTTRVRSYVRDRQTVGVYA